MTAQKMNIIQIFIQSFLYFIGLLEICIYLYESNNSFLLDQFQTQCSDSFQLLGNAPPASPQTMTMTETTFKNDNMKGYLFIYSFWL